ncbi:MAG TPA: hypothetical protein VFN68_02210 [Acidimicrobiales bacterium]|nr:hypothetical protein [Acidimicrobiales bacterium]
MDPSIDQLTKRSGLSARSIFRYFEGLDDLRRAVIQRHFERLEPLLDSAGDADSPLDGRIKRFVDIRIKVNESLAGPARTAQLRAPYAPVIAADIHRYRKILDSHVREHFAPELKARTRAEADDLVALIDVIVSVSGWDLMVNEYDRSRTQVRRAWTHALEALLAHR